MFCGFGESGLLAKVVYDLAFEKEEFEKENYLAKRRTPARDTRRKRDLGHMGGHGCPPNNIPMALQQTL